MRDEIRLEQCNVIESTVDTVSLYTLTPGATSMFRALRICSGFCPKSDIDISSKKLRIDEAQLDDPFAVFLHNGSIALSRGLLPTMILITLAFTFI